MLSSSHLPCLSLSVSSWADWGADDIPAVRYARALRIEEELHARDARTSCQPSHPRAGSRIGSAGGPRGSLGNPAERLTASPGGPGPHTRSARQAEGLRRFLEPDA